MIMKKLFKKKLFKKKLFEKVFILTAVLLLLTGTFSASALETSAFTAQDTSTKNNRIFTITISGKGKTNLSAVKFDFTYDSYYIEFRSAKGCDDDTVVKFYEEKGHLKLIFLNEKGVDLSDNPELFTVDFKAENMTSPQQIAFTAADCVNSSVETVEAVGGVCNVSLIDSGTLTSSAAKGSASSGKSSSAVSSDSSTSAKSRGENEDDKAENADNSGSGNQEKSGDNKEQLNVSDGSEKFLSVGEKDNTLQIFASGAVIMFLLIALCGVSYHIGKKSGNKDE